MAGKGQKQSRINGRVLDRRTRTPLAGLRVEAWDKDLIFDDLLGVDTTDEGGNFRLEFDEHFFKEAFLDRRPDIIFKVFRGDTPIEVAGPSALYNLGDNEVDVVLEVEAGVEQSPAFAVAGRISREDGTPLRGVVVRAFDKDMRHEELLGESRTDADGRYEIRYHAGQFRRAEKKGADLIVRAFADDGTTLAASPTVFNARPAQTIDLAARDAVSEYERLVAELAPAVGGVPFAELKPDDIAFLAGETGFAPGQLAHLASAARWAAETGITAEAFYGLLREGMPDTLPALLAESPERQRAALVQAILQGIIPARLGEEVNEILEGLRQVLVQQMLGGGGGAARPPLGELLGPVLQSAEQQAAFVSLWIQHADAGASPDDFWDVLREDGRFTSADVDGIRSTMQLAAITLNYAPLVEALQRERQAGLWSTPRDLARRDAGDWAKLIEAVAGKAGDELPAGVAGEGAARISNYAAAIAGELERQFPTAVLAHRLGRDESFDLPHKQDVLTFLNNNTDFELAYVHVRTYVAERGATSLQGIRDVQGLTGQLEAMQRVAHVAEGYEQTRALLTYGFDSALAVTRVSPEQFVEQYGKSLGGAEKAAAVYESAGQKAATTVNVLADLCTLTSGVEMPVLPGAKQALNDISDLRTLFGSLDYCACEHCRSVLSPAAYLVDALQFLSNRASLAEGRSALDVLFERRPDLGEIELTCENTNTRVPYTDLVNEVLENAVAPVVPASDWLRLPLTPGKHEQFQTRLTEEQLGVYPEHVNTNAYVRLRSAAYPWTLPFDLWAEEIRVYLGQLNTTRAALIEVLRPPASAADASAVEIARDTLGLPAAAWDVIADQSARDPGRFWGRPGLSPEDLSPVPTFLERSGLTHAELIELLATRFINPDTQTRAVTLEPAAACDLDEMRLTGLTVAVLSKVHRFVRLWRIIGWAMRDLDMAIRLLGGGTLGIEFLLRLSELVRVRSALKMTPAQVMSFWAPLDADGPLSLYNSVFWNPVLRSQFSDPALDPARLAPNGNVSERVSAHFPPILAALGVTVVELETLLRGMSGSASADSPADAPLTLETLSNLYRHVLLGRALRLTAADLLVLKRLTGIDPFDPADTGGTLRFVKEVGRVQASDFSPAELAYLFLIPAGGASPAAPTAAAVVRFVDDLRASLHNVRDDTSVTHDPEGAQTRKFLSLLNWGADTVERLVTTLGNRVVYQTRLGDLPADFSFPRSASDHVSYDRAARLLRYRGVMTSSDRDLLLADPAVARLTTEQRTAVGDAVRELYEQPRRFTRRALAAFAYRAPLAALPSTLRIPPEMDGRLAYDQDARTLSFAGPMTADERELLRNQSTDASYRVAIDALFAAPDAATGQPPDLALLTAPEVLTLLDTAAASDRFARLLARLQLHLRRMLGTGAVVQILSDSLGLAPNLLRPLLSQHLSSVRTPGQTMLADLLDTDYAGASEDPPFAHLRAAFRRLHKVALLLSKLRASSVELGALFGPAGGASADFDLNLLARVGEAAYRAPDAYRVWAALADLSRLRDRHGSAGLAEVLALSRNPTPDEREAARAVGIWGGWRAGDVLSLANAWGIRGAALVGVHSLARLAAGCDLLKQLGVTAEECLLWAATDLRSAEHAQRVSESVRQAVKARYSTEQWPAVSRPARDRLRERQAAALTDFLIARSQMTEPPEVTTDDGRQFRNLKYWSKPSDLYAYFLIDVEMSSCQPTSRIRLAHSVVQLFVQRCLMNLEADVQADAGRDSHWREWEWMKNYRVWEANRQVFNYPENWIEPELRDDKTDFFKNLENELLQNDLTAATAEAAFINYFESLDTVSRLEICGMCRQPGEPTLLHVFGRTRGTPHVYYYRRQIRTDYAASWTPWVKVNVDIEGDHLIPVVWNNRLYLFWPTFIEQSEQPAGVSMPRAEQPLPSPSQEPRKYSKMQLAWSQYRNNGWTGKTVSDEFARIPVAAESDLYFQARPTDGADLEIRAYVRSVTAELRQHVRQLQELRRTIDEAGRTGGSDATQRKEEAQRRETELLNRGVTPEVTMTSFLLSGSDGIVRRLPAVHHDFVRPPRGTHLVGMTFAEALWREADAVDRNLRYARAPLAMPLNTPEGRSDVARGSAEIPTALPASGSEAVVVLIARPFSFEQVYTAVGRADLRAAAAAAGAAPPPPDHRLWLTMPAFGTQAVLHGLPAAARAGVSNLFRVLVPYDQLAATSEFFYQDDTRTFYADIEVDPEIAREVERLRRSVNPDEPGYFLFLAFVLGPLLIAGSKYQFYTHYHPYARALTQCLNLRGLEGLLQRRTQTHPHELSTPPQSFDFARAYRPDGRWVHPRHPVEEMDFSPDGTYSQYNWELFFHAPLLIADRLSKNQRFAEAQRWFHTIFDPTDMSGEEKPRRYWRTRPFFEIAHETYQRERIDNLLRRLAAGDDDRELSNQVAQWREHPFNPHLVARTRTTAFQKAVVMKYLDNLIAWADQLFRQDTMESVNEATQLYVMAAEILGPRPQRIQPQAAPPAQTYYQLRPRLDDYSNALVRLENLTPRPKVHRASAGLWADPEAAPPPPAPKPQTLKPPTDLYFCVPRNDKLLGYWDTVADRLFKIRHCMNIEGLARQLPLFEPPIDPGLLVRATALGVDIGSALGDTGAPLPHYRFPVMLQKAMELCGEVRGFGAALLSALEKRDAEGLALLRSGHELNVLSQVRQVREQQLAEAVRGLEALRKSQEAVTARRDHYANLAFMSPGEGLHLVMMGKTMVLQHVAAFLEQAGAIGHLLPNFKLGFFTSIGATYGGQNVGEGLQAFARYLNSQATAIGTTASLVATLAGYGRRAEEWGLQVKLAGKELEQIEKQIAAAEIRVEIARRELSIHELHARQTREVDTFMRTRYTNRELYDWMAGQLSTVYFQSYQLAYDMAKRAERAYRFERGETPPGMIQFGYWDSLRRGLLAGERLMLDLRRLEAAYIDQNRRDHELTKHVSLALLDPFALHLLRTTGSCTVTLPESLFDRDHPGHYMRRIKAVALTLPAVVGPYTSVNCRLTLQSSAIRVSPELLGGGRYLPEPDTNGDARFRSAFGSVQTIATSRAHSDAGLFEVNFRDERYLPFEGAGVISTWQIELDPLCNDFDLTTLSDVVMELHYTARDGGRQLRDRCREEVLANPPRPEPRGRLFSARTDFADAWNAFLYPLGNDPGQTLSLSLDRDRFPFRAQRGRIELTELHVVLVLGELGKQHYSEIAGGGIRVLISNPGGTLMSRDTEGLLLRVGGDPRVGEVPGGAQPLTPAVRVNETGGANRWQVAIPQTVIDALPAQLRAPAVAGRTNRLSPEMFDDLLVFAVYTVGA